MNAVRLRLLRVLVQIQLSARLRANDSRSDQNLAWQRLVLALRGLRDPAHVQHKVLFFHVVMQPIHSAKIEILAKIDGKILEN